MIGIMSDSHDHMGGIRAAVKVFNQEKVELVVHAGDLISPFTAGAFDKLHAPLEAIFGNNDGERRGLMAAYAELCPLEDFKELEVDGRKIALIHGTTEALVDALRESGKFDLVIRGHTHRMEVTEGLTMVVNPGETCGYLSGDKTVVLLDTQDLSWEKVQL
ncbi:MAG TPA: metallophosphoesterase [Methanobacterium subterraneum]|uniref:Phosphoesterase n=1 Tax=Methanobacterium subterraneum TaxID=59277 RepID=A0A2H4VBN7_9EURY|nr:metallophosphoesterase [Methanobacterium subterraneum]AUB55470.1 YfcE family phosphodiesterase [Methanobacterium subterraneum]PKL72216.1 MAG: YfcE family phosphodiesterase [Methanobacteriales archaeon HGW-Methanobacteriales-2]HII84034.1 metallophosphoesterase [Methanobacterium subterraneum]